MRYLISTVSGKKRITTYQDDKVTTVTVESHSYQKEVQYRKDLIFEVIKYINTQNISTANIKAFLQTNRNQLIDYERGISADLLTAITANAVLTAQQKTDLANILTI